MLKTVKTDKQTRGREVIAEAAQFLRQMRFHPNRGAYAQGKHIAVSVNPQWNDDNETMRVLITCYAFGNQRVDWQGLPVFAESLNGGGVAWLCFLNARGQAVMPNLTPDDYRLSVPTQFGRSAEPIPLLAPALALAAASRVGQDVVLTHEPHVYESTDGTVRATLRLTETGHVVVAVETNEVSLSGATVHFAFVQPSGAVEHSGTVTLQPVADEEGLWEGRWEGTLQLAEPCEFVFEVPTG